MVMDAASSDTPTADGNDDERPSTEKYEGVSPEDVADDAIEFLREGNDDPRPATPPPADDEQPPPNA